MHAASQIQPVVDELIEIFDQCFAQSYNTRLTGGAPEPVYLPADPQVTYHRVVFTRDYFASALHEVAHWCIAGDRRRCQVDYGYWYAPDGRTAEQQKVFERVEVRPQALEWLFSEACGEPFRVSADNLDEGLGASAEFKADIVKQAQIYCRNEPPARARQFIGALAAYYGVTNPLNRARFTLARVR